MKQTINSATDQSVTGAYAAVALLVGLLLVASYPFQFAVVAVVLGSTVLVGRTLWRQATTRGLGVPGSAARLRVNSVDESDHTRWSLTVAVVEDS